MSLHPGEAWAAVSSSPLFGIVVTLGAYSLARELWRRTGGHALLNPVLVAIVLVGVVLAVTRVDYESYMAGGAFIGFLLGPATVALAWPLHLELALVRRAVLPVAVGILVGSGVAVLAGVALTSWLGGSDALALSMAPKSATTPVSIALAETVGGVPALTAVLTILAGIVGAVAGPRLLTLLRVRDARVRGLAVGVASHGIGTAQMVQEGRTQGAFAGLAMALTALATSVWVPLLVPLLV